MEQSEYQQMHPPDFVTHLNYVSCLNDISTGLSIMCNKNTSNIIKKSKKLDKKLTIIKLIKKSLDLEYKTVNTNPDFAEVCVPWIAIKAYYLLFNLMLIINYLLSANDDCFNDSHEKTLNTLNAYIKQNILKFNIPFFNGVYTAAYIKNLRFKSGENVKLKNVDVDTRCLQSLKKLLSYKLEDFQRKNKIKNFKTKKNQERRNDFIKNTDINICEFFYWYRIKANYWDLEFLDKNIDCEQFSDFYKNYYCLTNTFYKAFKGLINTVAKERLGKEILLANAT